MLLIGMDRLKAEAMLLSAYDDRAGVTAAFNLNLIDRINRELGGDIPRAAFAHRARWNDPLGRIEMHLEALGDLRFAVAGHEFAMRSGETIHTENSHKYDLRSAAMLLLAAGWTPRAWQTDSAKRFYVALAEATEPRTAP